MNKNHYVYLITNLINGKKYIGKISCNCPIEEDQYMGSGKILRNAKLKYGNENFIKSIIEVCNTENDAYEREKYWIEEYNAFDSNEFYNLTPGGEGNSTYNRFEVIDNNIAKFKDDNMYINNAFMRNKELNIQEKSFYIYVRGYGDKCFANQSTICDDLAISKPTLRKLMKSLEDKSYIYVQRKYSARTKEKATPVIFPIPLDENTGLLTEYHKEIIEYTKYKYPSDY
ncbi:GIY-YIG nuclease family protein [Clostridium perfringens]|nr:GIY-YIG nuclease family protein [Clostridium perfringens]